MKVLKKLGIEGMFFNIIKAKYDTLGANIILKGEQLEPSPIKLGIRQNCLLSPLVFSIV
jgi:hypothetical protein